MGEVDWPLLRNKIRRGKLSNTFGAAIRIGLDGKPRNHQGWDFYAAEGTPCMAIASGMVVFVADKGDYGVQLCHSFTFEGKKLYAFYAHLKRGSVLYQAGWPVELGKLIALTGNTGNAENMKGEDQHLHFEIRDAHPAGAGMSNRISPVKVFKFCPLHQEAVKVTKGSTMLYNAGIGSAVA